MIALPEISLPAPQSVGLSLLQVGINSLKDYPARVKGAKAGWECKPAAIFDVVRDRLILMCSGNRRCVYCEDSFADEIEHMRPKDLYPSQAYLWENYLFSCGPCNGPKSNRFAVVDPLGNLIDVTRSRRAPVVPPVRGTYALINPRIENPLDFIWLDFMTYRYTSLAGISPVSKIRADYTIKTLRLNERDALVKGRKGACSGFLGRLERWVQRRDVWSQAEKDEHLLEFRTERYRGVWEQMKRQINGPRMLEFAKLMAIAPEANAW